MKRSLENNMPPDCECDDWSSDLMNMSESQRKARTEPTSIQATQLPETPIKAMREAYRASEES